MQPKASRRDFLAVGGTLAGAGVCGSMLEVATTASPESSPGFRYCLNFSTLQGYRSGLVEMVEVAAQAGYQAIEPWVSGLHAYEEQAGSLLDLGRRIGDLGLSVESAIAFPEWIVDDPGKRAIGMEQAKRDMDAVPGLAANASQRRRQGPTMELRLACWKSPTDTARFSNSATRWG